MNDNELIKFYNKFSSSIKEELNNYLIARKNYLYCKNGNTKSDLFITYDLIYTSTKHLWVSGRINTEEFQKLKESLSDISEVNNM